jgi:DNA-binding MarR family transcriptional regulator
MSTTITTADARSLALAHYAARGVLEQVLARQGMTFQEQITLRAAAVDTLTPAELIAEVHGSLKADPASIEVTVDELVSKGLLAETDGTLHPTDAGRAVLAAAAAEVAPFSARIWEGIPAEDLAAAGRVLALVTERANAELAAMAA